MFKAPKSKHESYDVGSIFGTLIPLELPSEKAYEAILPLELTDAISKS